MDSVDIIDRLIPSPSQTLVVKTPAGDFVLVDTKRPPKSGDKVLVDDAFKVYQGAGRVSGVAYCSIKFL